jgi:hypothetical protein
VASRRVAEAEVVGVAVGAAVGEAAANLASRGSPGKTPINQKREIRKAPQKKQAKPPTNTILFVFFFF